MLTEPNYNKSVGRALLESLVDGGFSLFFNKVLPAQEGSNSFLGTLRNELVNGLPLDIYYASKPVGNKKGSYPQAISKRRIKKIPQEKEEEEYATA